MIRDDTTSAIREARLASILRKWQDAAPLSFFKTVPKQDLLDAGIPIEDLEKHGLVSSATSDMVVAANVGKREMCRILTAMFGNGKEVFPEQLTRAVEKDGMHGWNKKQSKFNTAQAIQWWRDNRAKTDTQLAEGAAADNRRKITLAKMAELDLAERERGINARWMEKEEHNRILANIGKVGRDDLWQKFDDRAYALFPAMLEERGLSDEWSAVAVNALRELNPSLLMQHHAHIEQLAKEAEQKPE